MTELSVRLSTSTFLRLAEFLKASKSARDPVDMVDEAVNYWIDNAEWKSDLLLPEAVRGYSWKIQKTSLSVFLPNGTTLRIKAKSGFEYAKVIEDELTYQGERLSPNQFALKAAGTPRDAWRDVWVKRPSDDDYQNADALRQATLG